MGQKEEMMSKRIAVIGIGGIGGYIDFLTTIHRSEDEEERGQAREWASSLGWTGRAIKPQNLL